MSYIGILTGVPLDVSYAHTRLFDNASQQLSYFQSFTPLYQNSDFNFVKMQGRDYVDIPARYDQLEHANYLFFQNSQTGDMKWYYCFINNIQTLTRQSTRIFFTRDVMQTWQFDYSLNQCVIEREHVASANGRNLLPENIQIGNEYVTVASENFNLDNNLWLVIACKRAFHDGFNSSNNSLNWIANHPDQLVYYLFPFSYNNGGSVTYDGVTYVASDLAFLLGSFSTTGGTLASASANNIVNIYVSEYFPFTSSQVFNVTMTADYLGTDYTVPLILMAQVPSMNVASNHSSTLYASNMISGVDNEKLNYYPFTIIELYDNRGNMVKYKPEGLTSTTMNFQILSSIGASQMCSVALDGYNGSTSPQLNKQRAIINNNAQDLPIITDYLSAFLQGNKNQLENQKQFLYDDYNYNTALTSQRNTGQIISRVGGLAVAGVGLALKPFTLGASTALTVAGIGMASGAMQFGNSQIIHNMQQDRLTEVYNQNISNIYARQEDMENQPPSVNMSSANLNYTMGNNLFNYTIAIKRVRPEYITMAQNYFSMFGFATNRIGIPNLKSRTSWNFIKMAMCNLTTQVYNDDMEMIRSIYQNGITFWHTNSIMDYTQSNTEVV